MSAEWLAPTVVSSAIAGGVAMATHFSSQRAKRVETKEDIRSEAFDQAKTFYTDVIERQEAEITSLRAIASTERVNSTDLNRRAKIAEDAADQARRAVRVTLRKLTEKDAEIARLTGTTLKVDPDVIDTEQ